MSVWESCLTRLCCRSPIPQARETAAGITVEDHVIDDQTAKGLLKAFPATSESVRSAMHVPEELFNKFKRWLSTPEEALAAHGGSAGAAVLVPVKHSAASHARHKDHYSVGRQVSGRVGVFYLSGDGQMVFTHDSSGEVSALAPQSTP